MLWQLEAPASTVDHCSALCQHETHWRLNRSVLVPWGLGWASQLKLLCAWLCPVGYLHAHPGSNSANDPPAFPSTSVSKTKQKYDFPSDDLLVLHGPLFTTVSVPPAKPKEPNGRRNTLQAGHLHTSRNGTRQSAVSKFADATKCPLVGFFR